MTHPSDEQLTFHHAVYDVVRDIPSGHVTSYGYVAKLIHRPRNARQVGQSLKYMDKYFPLFENPGFSLASVPWWRVVNSKGGISERDTGVTSQVDKLRNEGIEVLTDDPEGANRFFVDMHQYGWYPDLDSDYDEDY